ncbi:MAG: hypothetical protein EBV06_12005 [Planctomycetia bacterium]|nr:hypothetical protein [Planctomycetia bacterium]
MARLIAFDCDQSQMALIVADVSGASVKVQNTLSWSEDAPLNSANADEFGRRLRNRLKDAGVAPAPLLVCIGRDRLIVKDIRFPPVGDTEEPAIVRFQTIKELTDAPDDVVIDYVRRSPTGEVERRASSVVIQKKLLDQYQKVAGAAGLKLMGVSPRLMGAMRSLRRVMGTTVVTPSPQPLTGTIALVLVGEKQAEIAIAKGEDFLLSRSVVAGPNLATEIKRNLAVHEVQTPAQPVVAIYLCGKGSGELMSRLKDIIETPVYPFDPLSAQGMETPRSSDGSPGPFAGPMGLLYLQGAGELPINWMSPRQPKPPADPNWGRMRLGLVVGVALLVGLLIMGILMTSAEESAIVSLQDQTREVEEKLKSAQDQSKRLKAIQGWVNPIWLDELYDLAGRTDLTKARFESITSDSITRTEKSKYVGMITMRGKLLATTTASRRETYDQLVAGFTKDGYYSIDTAFSKFEDTAFVLVVRLIHRGPSEYKTVLEDPTIVKDAGKSKSRSTRN